MKLKSPTILFIALLTGLIMAGPPRQLVAGEEAPLRRFLTQYCSDCHGSQDPAGDLDFTQPLTSPQLQNIFDQLAHRQMPPRDADQPTTTELIDIIGVLAGRLDQQTETTIPRGTLMRRLNQREYNHTLRDLLRVDTEYNPSRSFPLDNEFAGTDNVGFALVFSPALMREAMLAADDVLQRAIRFGPQPVSAVHRILPRHATRPVYQNGEYVKIVTGTEDGFQQFRPGSKDIAELAQGNYRIRVHAIALHSDFKGVGQIDGPVRMKVRVGPPGKQAEAGSRRLVDEVDVPEDKPTTFHFTARLEKGQVPIVSFTNGHRGSFKNLVRRRYGPDARQTRQPIMEKYDGPQLRVFWMEVEGPLFDQWPPAGNLLVFGKQMQPENQPYINKVLHAFVQRAFRRKVDDATVQPFLDLYQKLRENGHPFESAIHTTFKAVLGSPAFLYHYETEGKLDSYSLVNRLSYFLWNTMPDQQLRDLADQGMPSRNQLTEQVDRMLDDPRAEDFIRSFVDNWLGIGKLGEMPPDPQRFADYYTGNLQEAMKRESQLLFKSLLETNGPVLDLLNSDYTYLNERLAQHYGIAGVTGDKFRRVHLPADSRRGGVLTQASVLTVTSNGTATSPVVRGVWMLENILGKQVNPPPDDIEPIEPDTRGATTIRQQLAKHQEQASCAVCHQHIDPLGFSMEHFDPVGLFRENYAHRRKIQTDVVLADGRELDGAEQLKQALVDQPADFIRCLTEKLLVYGTGGALQRQEYAEVFELVDRVQQQQHGLRDLIVEITLSDAFRTK
ncbi:MAG: DUF1592 domain-containing protein [Planctomycetota bacterium]|nr:DUF1592 domain-containing protein [Planctomycetota bacterium]